MKYASHIVNIFFSVEIIYYIYCILSQKSYYISLIFIRMSTSSSENPTTTLPPHIMAANAGDNVAALAMAPLPDGSGSHAEAAVKHLAKASENQQAANNISGGSKRKRGGASRTYKRSRRGRKPSRKRRSKKHYTKRRSHKSRHYKKKK